MAIVKQDLEHTGSDLGQDLMFGAGLLVALLLLVWLAQFVASAVIYLGELLM